MAGADPGAGPRLRALVRAFPYASLAVLTVEIIAGTGRSQAESEQSWSAKVMHYPGGRLAVGIVGDVARGLIFTLAGALVVQAAVTYQPASARGLDKALLTLRDQPFGAALLDLAALGLIVFGVYALFEARWHKV